MNRRELLKPLAALTLTPLFVKGQEVGKSVAIQPTSKYALFVDGDMVDVRALVDTLYGIFPGGTPIYAVMVPPDKTIDDAIRIYKVEE